MSFLAPVALGLSALSIPIILLYMLRLRRRDVPVSSTMLWQQLLRDREANAPWQRLRRNLLLFLQLLVLAALVFALARPFVEVPTVTTGRIALLLDASASMNANDVQPNRFEAAKQQAYGIVDTLSDQDSLAVIRVADGPEVVANYTNNRVELHDAISKMEPSDSSADWNAALTLAAAGANGADKFTVLVIGDGGLPTNLSAAYGNIKFIPVGKSDSNMAITALATASDPTSGPQIYARISNYGSQNANVIFSVNLDGKLFNASSYSVAANGYTDVVVPNLPKSFTKVEATLTRPAASTVPDYLALDDTAYTVFNPNSAGRVLLMTQQNRFIEQGFASLSDWQAFRASLDKGLPAETYDLYVFDGYLPPQLPNANMLIVNPPSDAPGNSAMFKIGADQQNARNLTVKPDDPRTRFLNVNDVNIRAFKTITDTPWADTLVNSASGPLVLAGEYGQHRVAIISFDLHNSDLPLKIAWPVLLSNLTEWYKTPQAVNVNGSLHPGQTASIQPGLQADLVRVTRPDGAVTTLKVDQPTLIYADTPMPGIYTVETYQGSNLLQTQNFAVNVFDENESRIAVRTPTFGSSATASSRPEEIGQREFWPWVALAALILLALEWFAYHRGLHVPSLGTAVARRFARRPQNG